MHDHEQAMLNLAEATDVFLLGFTRTRSRTHPYVLRRDGPVTWMEDAPRRSGDRRCAEGVAVEPYDHAAVLAALERYPSPGYRLCLIHSGSTRDPELEQTYREAGYGLMVHEPFFVKPVHGEADADIPGVELRRVTQRDPAYDRMVAANRGRKPLPKGDPDDPLAWRLYAALVADEVVGAVTSVPTGAQKAWVSNLWVASAHRRRGIGGALMRHMLAEDERHGVRWSVLLASLTGALLYPRVGYHQIGTLEMFTPARRRGRG